MFPLWLLLLPFFLLCAVAYRTARPRQFPRNIPVIPLWLHVYDMMRGVSRADFYNARVRRFMEKQGAVALWHEGRWTVLVARPDYLIQVFKNTDRTLKKNGFYHRVPWGSGAQLFGENIIDSSGELHTHFSKIIKPGISRPASITCIKAKSNRLAAQLWQMHKSANSAAGIPIGESIWHWAVSVFADHFMDTQFWPMDYSKTNVQQIIGAQNSVWLGRIKGLFPVLDRLPWKLPISQRTYTLFRQLEKALLDHVESRARMPRSPQAAGKLIYLLTKAREEGQLSDFHYRSNLKQLYVAGHENAETTLLSAMSELAAHPELQGLLHAEVTGAIPVDYSAEDLDRLPLLNAVIYETLRLYPPLGTLTNRRTTEPFRLGTDVLIPAGVLIGWHAYGIHTDPRVWGESAGRFDPFRWGKDCAIISRTVHSHQARGLYIPFGSHSRKCLGRPFVLMQLKVGLCELVRNIEWQRPGGYTFSFSKAALIAPDNFTLVIRKREGCSSVELGEQLSDS